MGRRKEKAIKLSTLIVTLFIALNFSYAQTKISGVITDINKTPLYSVNILLKDSIDSSILDYSHSETFGKYVLKTTQKGTFNLFFSSLGFESKTIAITIDKTQTDIKIDIIFLFLANCSVQPDSIILESLHNS